MSAKDNIDFYLAEIEKLLNQVRKLSNKNDDQYVIKKILFLDWLKTVKEVNYRNIKTKGPGKIAVMCARERDEFLNKLLNENLISIERYKSSRRYGTLVKLVGDCNE